MKKLLYIAIFSLLFLSGCEKKPAPIADASLFHVTDGVTADGIKCGDGPDAFIKAYKDYTIQVAYSQLESNYLVMSIKDIPYNDQISTIIANFFINGTPMAEETICDENDIQLSELHSLLSSSAYLRSHEVIYRYLDFEWQDGVITDISSEELNYNETFETPCVE